MRSNRIGLFVLLFVAGILIQIGVNFIFNNDNSSEIPSMDIDVQNIPIDTSELNRRSEIGDNKPNGADSVIFKEP